MTIRILFSTLIFLAGCNDINTEIPAGIISRDSMVNIMADIHIAEARLINSATVTWQKEVKSAYMQEVLKKADIDTARFLTSFEFYSANPQVFSEMYEHVIVEISKRQAEKR